jgi:hypothetical protein
MAAVYAERNKYAHLNVATQEELLLEDASPAEKAIKTIRQAVHELYTLLSSTAPEWIDDDVLPRHMKGGSTLTVGHGLQDPDDSKNIRITFLYRDREGTPYVLPPDADPEPYMHEVIKSTFVPISRVRAYQEGKVIAEVTVRMRGSSTS